MIMEKIRNNQKTFQHPVQRRFLRSNFFATTSIDRDGKRFCSNWDGREDAWRREEMGLMGSGGNLERGDFERFVDGRKRAARIKGGN